jgi:N-acetyl-anhydromuramyl-L-alanine amidase AmpD
VLPKINCDYPRDPDGKLIPRKLNDEKLNNYQGVLGHYHIQTNKNDPGPALDWDQLIGDARNLMKNSRLRSPAPTGRGQEQLRN